MSLDKGWYVVVPSTTSMYMYLNYPVVSRHPRTIDIRTVYRLKSTGIY